MRLPLLSALALAGDLVLSAPCLAAIVETTPAAGLSAVTSARPGAEVPVYTVGLLGDNATALQSVTVSLADLSSPTGIDPSTFSQLRLYRSSNPTFDGNDVLVGTQSAVALGAPTTVALTTPAVWGFSERYYIVTAVLNQTHADEPDPAKDAFRLAAAAGGVATSAGGLGSVVVASDAARVVIDVVATRLAFTVLPGDGRVFDPADEVVSGRPFATQPVLQAQDDFGNLDVDFQGSVSLSKQSGNGVLSGQNTRSASSGTADFSGSGLTFTSAGSDGQSFILRASASGLTQAFAPLSADAVATELVFTTSPAHAGTPRGDVVSGLAFGIQPVLQARDLNGVVDDDFNDLVTVSLQRGGGALAGTVHVRAVAGVVACGDLAYAAAADQDTFQLRADDEAGGSGGDLPLAVDAAVRVADVVATRAAFAVLPAGAGTPHGDIISGQPFATAPVLEARDAGGARDLHFASGNATLSVASGSVALGGTATAPWVAGRASFAGAGLAATATADQEPFTLRASSAGLTPATTPTLVADAVASRLVFVVAPAHPGTPRGDVISGQPFATQPALEAQDAAGVRDAQFAGGTATLAVASGSVVLSSPATATWAAGRANFSGLAVSALADSAAFALSAISAGLAAATTGPLIADAVASRVVFAVAPADSSALHGSVVDGRVFPVQPVLEARDAAGARDLHVDGGAASVSVASGAVGLQGTTTRTWVRGRADFAGAGLKVLGSQDGQTFVLAGSGSGLAQGLSPLLIDDVVATRLVLTQGPAHTGTPRGDVISGRAFSTQPVVQAQDAAGRTDIHFDDLVTLTAAPGQLRGTATVGATNGVASFAGLAYLASQDQEGFQLRADDQAAGAEGDLPAISDTTRVADVVATRIAFAVPPADPAALHGSVVNGKPFAVQPVLEAQDSSGVRDLHVAQGSVALSVLAGPATLRGSAVRPWVSGRADFAGSQLRVTAPSDGALFTLAATGTSLAPGVSPELTVDALATRMAFAALPADPAALRGNVVNGRPFATQPVLEAQDSSGVRDAHYAQGSAVLSVASGRVVLQGLTATRPWTAGRADFAGTGLRVVATQDTQTFALGAQSSGFAAVSTPGLVSDVVASRVVFAVPPADPAAVHGSVANGKVFATQPVLEAQDSTGVRDADLNGSSVVLSVPSGPSLQGATTRPWSSGRADFAGAGLRVIASQDPQSFALAATSSGLADAVAVLTCDAVASRLRFVLQPAQSGVATGTVVQDQPFSTQPVVEAQDSLGLRDAHLTSGAVTLSVASGNALLRGSTRQDWQGGRADFAGHGLALDVRVDGERVALRASADPLPPAVSDTLRVDLQATRLVFLQGPQAVGARGAELAATPIRVAAVYGDSTVDAGYSGSVTLQAVLPGSDASAPDPLAVLPGPVLSLAQGQAVFTSVIYAGLGPLRLMASCPGLQPARTEPITLSGSVVLVPPDRQVPDQLLSLRSTRPEGLPLLALALRPDGESLVVQDLRVQLELRGGLAPEHLALVQLWRDQGTVGALDAADQLVASAAALDSLAVFSAVADLLESARSYLVTWTPAAPLLEGWRIRGRVAPTQVRARSPRVPGLAAVPVGGPTVEGNLHTVGRLGPPHHLRLSATPDSLTADSLARATLSAEVLDAWDQLLTLDTTTVVTFATLSGGVLIDGPLTAAARQGRAATVLRAGTAPGSARIRASAPGLVADTTAVVLSAGPPAKLEVTVAPATLLVGGTGPAALRVALFDAHGNPTGGGAIPVELRVSSPGTLTGAASGVLRLLAPRGVAEAGLQAGQAGRIAVLAAYAGLADTLEVLALSARSPRLALRADTLALPADGSRHAHLEVLRLDDQDQLAAGDDSSLVALSVVQGQGLLSLATTRLKGGRAGVELQALGTAGPLRVRAASAGLQAAELELSARAAAARRLDLVALPARVPADGQATAILSAVVRDTLGNLVADTSLAVDFAVENGQAEIIGPLSASAVGGIARTTLRASVRAGQVTVRSQAGSLRPGRATLDLLPGQPAKLLLQARPSALPAQPGASCELVALVQDVYGNTVASDSSTLVSFSVSGGPGSVPDPAVGRCRDGVARSALTAVGPAGEVLVFAGAPGLAPSTLTVSVRQAQAPVFRGLPARIQLVEDGPPARWPLSSVLEDQDHRLRDLALSVSPPSGPVRLAVTGDTLQLWSVPDYSGTQSVELVARDPDGLEARTRVVVEVAPVNDPPRVVSTPDTLAWIDSLYVYQVKATDPDGDPLRVRLAEGPGAMGFDRVLQRAVWRPGLLGTYPVRIVVSDGTDSVSQAFQIRVRPRPSQLRFTSQPALSIRRGQLFTYRPVLEGAGAVAFSLVRAPDRMRVDAGTGLLTWVPTTSDADSVEVLLRARAGSQEALQGFRLRVVPANQSPRISSEPNPVAWVDSLYQYPLRATDADGDSLVYQLISGPAGMRVDARTGLCAWVPTAADVGPVQVVLGAFDGQATTTQSVALQVRPWGAGGPPRLAGVRGVALDPEERTATLALDPLVTDAVFPDSLLTWQAERISGDQVHITYDALARSFRFAVRPGFVQARVRLRVQNPALLSAEAVLTLSPLRAGDLDRDTAIDLGDFFRIVDCFGATPDSANWRPGADLDGNGRIDAADYRRFLEVLQQARRTGAGTR